MLKQHCEVLETMYVKVNYIWSEMFCQIGNVPNAGMKITCIYRDISSLYDNTSLAGGSLLTMKD